MSRPTVQIYYSRATTVFFISITMLPVIGGAYLGSIAPYTLLVFGFPSLVFLIISIRKTWRQLIHREPQLILEATGLRAAGLSKVVPWEQIKDIVPGHGGISRGPSMMYLIVSAEHDNAIQTESLLGSKLLPLLKQSPNTIGINITDLAVTRDQLTRLVNEYRKASDIDESRVATMTDSTMPKMWVWFLWTLTSLMYLMFLRIFIR